METRGRDGPAVRLRLMAAIIALGVAATAVAAGSEAARAEAAAARGGRTIVVAEVDGDAATIGRGIALASDGDVT